MKKKIFAVLRALLVVGAMVGLQACFEEEYGPPGYYGGYRYESPWHEWHEHEHQWHHWHHDDD